MVFGKSAVTAMSGLSENLGRLVVSPVKRWKEATPLHKLLALGLAGAGAYYIHSRGADERTVALTALGVAYGSSMLMHYPQVMGSIPMPTAQGVPTGVAPQQLSAMQQNAAAALSSMQPSGGANGNGGLSSLSGSLGAALGALGGGAAANGGSQWSGLGQ